MTKNDMRGGEFIIGPQKIAAKPPVAGLYVVATPIGNLADITLRALETLAGADVIACEDTRVTRILLDRYGIRTRMTAYHEHNADTAGPRLVAAMQDGQAVALVSDAGTPLVSDPGYRLVEQALAADLPVTPIPGPSAMVAALSACGLPTDAFFFAGFLPARAGQRVTRLSELKTIPGTLVFYESPRRLAETLAAMAETLGATRPATVMREITKTFEEARRATLGELADHYAQAGAPKGEIVICVGGPVASEAPGAGDIDALLAELSARLPASKAAGEASRLTGLPKQDLFRRLVALKGEPGEDG